MRFDAFCERLSRLESVSADTDVVAAVAALFATADADLPTAARFVQGRVFPAWDATTLDVGPRLCYAALARAAGPNVSGDDVESRVAETGDVGDVAAGLDLGSQQGLGAFTDGASSSLTVASVDDELRALAESAGDGSASRKEDRLFGLFNRCTPAEARYLARLVLGAMRVGVGEGTVRDATTAAFEVPVDAVEHALQVSNDYGLVARVARDEGERGLRELSLAVGRPVQAMLAQAGTAEEALEAWETVAVETKFDGARVQLHHTDDETWAFSRNMADVTDALPEVREFADRALGCPVILDGEVVAVDDDGAPLPFQEVLRRFRRKHDVEQVREEVGLAIRLFDCLHADGDDLLDAPFETRHARLESVVDDPNVVSKLTLASDLETVEAHEERALGDGHEGIMLKNPASPYTPGRRGKNWLKRKPDVETLDLVVTGAEWGEGRRASFLGTFEVSARVEAGDSARFAPVGKVATGITDETLADLTEHLEPLVESESGKAVDIHPDLVLEVGYEEIQASQTYESGAALRFPRLVAIREKPPAEADTLARLRALSGRE
ncbi:ATP-dependent DNA ligase LigA [Salinigranum halophilum]|uniref:ATP-dependent DNA ligase LigA n=1 Tax=Salinigranum halophilum TaxID=2565931 RepID=UPI00115D282C|nr:ATP-dependent DNA ligase LigA [Salinigranum halophilum]